MGHHLTLFIGRAADHGETFHKPPFLGTVEMAEDFVATPLEHAVIDHLGDEPTAAERIEAAGRRLSKSGPILFVETEFFGGTGGKEAAVWIDGERRLAGWDEDNGPHWFMDAPKHDFVFDDAAILAFGLSKDDEDFFAIFGLDRWRHLEEMTDALRQSRGFATPFGVILAGGQSTRMGGGDKGLLTLGGQTILRHVLDRLEPQVGQIALNANGDPARFAAYNLPVIPDSIDGFAGPLAGVLAGLDWAANENATHIITAAADTPFFPDNLTSALVMAAETQAKPIALARTENGRHPTFGLWPVSLRDDLRTALQNGVRKVVQWTDSHGTAMTDFPTRTFDPFFNVNTPEDLAQAETYLADMA